ncbi:MAG TPA: hypothetical protein VEK15_11890 [Vicinamibacteria bacterium]|nr:hypothetical protein [Vicinamibacteria bacterium]
MDLGPVWLVGLDASKYMNAVIGYVSVGFGGIGTDVAGSEPAAAPRPEDYTVGGRSHQHRESTGDASSPANRVAHLPMAERGVTV